jgi:hypothetical protein
MGRCQWGFLGEFSGVEKGEKRKTTTIEIEGLIRGFVRK